MNYLLSFIKLLFMLKLDRVGFYCLQPENPNCIPTHTDPCFMAHFLKKHLTYKLQSHLGQMQGSFKVIQNQLKFQHTLNMTFQCYQSEVNFTFYKLRTVRALKDICNICRQTYCYILYIFVSINFTYKMTISYGSTYYTHERESILFLLFSFFKFLHSQEQYVQATGWMKGNS